jgi:hypothetical protein
MNKGLVVPIVTTVVGVAWLLNVLQVMPGVDWLWTAGLAAAGVLALAVGGLNRVSVVIGPFLLVSSVLSVMRQTGKLAVDREMPILVIVLGLLMLVAQLARLPLPEALQDPADTGAAPD